MQETKASVHPLSHKLEFRGGANDLPSPQSDRLQMPTRGVDRILLKTWNKHFIHITVTSSNEILGMAFNVSSAKISKTEGQKRKNVSMKKS
jgi:hypothetical protein